MQNKESAVMLYNPNMKSKKLLLALAFGQALGLSSMAADWPQYNGRRQQLS